MERRALRFEKSDDLVTRKIAGETVIVMVRAHVAELDYVYTLDAVGTRIWELLEDHSIEQITESIRDEFEVGAAPLGSDILEFIATLQEGGLIRAMEAEDQRDGNA
ncbi:MAG TPA: PqqD family protein [Acidobacteriota bacterium]